MRDYNEFLIFEERKKQKYTPPAYVWKHKTYSQQTGETLKHDGNMANLRY